MQSGWSSIQDSGDFINRMKRIRKVPKGSFLVTSETVSLYPRISHKVGDLSIKKKIRTTNIF